MFAGSVIFVSTFIVVIRRHYFRRKLADIVAYSASGRRALENIEHDEDKRPSANDACSPEHFSLKRRKTRDKAQQRTEKASVQLPRKSVSYGHGAFPAPWEIQGIQHIVWRLFKSTRPMPTAQHHPYLSFIPRVDERGRMHGLNEFERAELGGVEYRTLGVLLWALIVYQVFWITLGTLFLIPYSYHPSMKAAIAGAQPGDLNPVCLHITYFMHHSVILAPKPRLCIN